MDYKIKGIIFDKTCEFEGLIDTIATQLGVDRTITEMVLQYKVMNPH